MRSILLLVIAIALGGCASMRSIDSDVSTYSRWPAERKPATYAFERLPSQQDRPEQQQRLENAARSAVEAAGFVLAADPRGADVTVQVGARTTAYDRSPFDDPFWWGRACTGRSSSAAAVAVLRPRGHHRLGPALGLSNHLRNGSRAAMIRDRKSGEPLYEARASSDGFRR